MRVIRSIFLFAVVLSSSIGVAQDSMKFKFDYELVPKGSYATLDDLSTSLLKDAYVLTRIGIKRSQFVRLDIRRMTSSILTLAAVQQLSEATEASDERVLAATNAMRAQQESPFLKRTDLTAGQQAALRRVALQEHQMDALLTKEVVFALRLSPEQVRRLNTVRQEYVNRCGQLEKKYADNQKVYALMKDFQSQDGDESSPTQKLELISKLCDALEDAWANTAAKIEGPLTLATKEANARAMRVLTSSQAREYRSLAK